MERSSGSGVFSRDPDSILTATPLPVDENLRTTHVIDEECHFIAGEIAKYNPDHQVPEADMMNTRKMDDHLMSAFVDLPNKQVLLQQIAKKRQQVKEQAALHTAWRLEGTLREFPSFRPISYWFKYPVYEVDHKLDTVAIENPETLRQEKWRKGVDNANRNKSEKAQNELEEAYQQLVDFHNDGAPISIVELAANLGISRQAAYKRVKKSELFEATDGIVTKNK